MGIYTYNVNVTYTPQNNNSFTAKRNYNINSCKDSLVGNNEAELWCNNLCAQDEKYCNPFIKGDKLYFQYFSDNTSFWKILPKLFDGATGLVIPSDAYITTETGADVNGNNYLNLIIDTTNIPIECFYLSVYLFNCSDVNEELYLTCVENAILSGATPEAAELSCSIIFCGDGVSQIFTEPYCLVKCENTLLIEGEYTSYDCNGNYYKPFVAPSTNSFKAQIRITAELVQQNFGFNTTIVNRNKQKSTQTDVYNLLTGKVPPYVAEKLALCFNAQKLFIDGVEYDNGPEIAKNNEVGQMWIINAQVTKQCSELSFNCE